MKEENVPLWKQYGYPNKKASLERYPKSGRKKGSKHRHPSRLPSKYETYDMERRMHLSSKRGLN